MNDTKSPKESFFKNTGHIFFKHLRTEKENLSNYVTVQKDKNHISNYSTKNCTS